MLSSSSASSPTRKNDSDESMGLSTLPYDLLLNVASYLDLRDIHALHLTSKSLHDFSTARPIYRKLASDLLGRCRALPLKGFQRLTDLSTEQLLRSVNRAAHYERAWRLRGPRPIRAEYSASGINSRSNYMDVTPNSKLAKKIEKEGPKWYKIISSPPGEIVDWLSPITSSYTLCATKNGKVVCWDVQSDTSLAEWTPGSNWELWKCRVEFEERTVFFTMAKVLSDVAHQDDRTMVFVLMRLTFSDGPSGESSPNPPVFSRGAEFRTMGVVMNVFLLDPSARLLSAFIYVANSGTIGLYVLPDWDENTYIYIDTGIECVVSSNWSCILHEQHIVIHCEESDAAFQHFYPISVLRTYSATLETRESTPVISRRLAPTRTFTKKFSFPSFIDPINQLQEEPDLELEMQQTINEEFLADTFMNTGIPILNGDALSAVGPSIPLPIASSPSSSSTTSSSSSSPTSSSSSSSSSILATPLPAPAENPNPYPFPPWYPESAHFVRQWWPSLPSAPRVSCTVVLLAAQDQTSNRTRFVLAQHYFRVPLDINEWNAAPPTDLPAPKGKQPEPLANGNGNGNGHPTPPVKPPSPKETTITDDDDGLMHLWYVSRPFEVVRILDDSNEDEEDGGGNERPRPLVAVDFGHAVWIEYVDYSEISRNHHHTHTHHHNHKHHHHHQHQHHPGIHESDEKWLRFVTFPSFNEEYDPKNGRNFAGTEVRTLEIPPELNLGKVETINIDQSQGAVILSDKDGRIFILSYE